MKTYQIMYEELKRVYVDAESEDQARELFFSDDLEIEPESLEITFCEVDEVQK